jgi:type II secretory pathway component PulK
VVGGLARDPRRGSILLLILVMIFVLSILIVQFTEKAMTEIAVEGHYADRERLRVIAYSALESTLAVLADVIAIDGGLTSPAQGWGDPLATAGFETESETTVTVTFSDESGKLPLSNADEVTLSLLFDRMGYDRDQAQHLTETLLDWIDSDDETRLDGAESDFYGEKEWPYHASNQPVRRLSELALVDGFKELFFDETGRPNESFRTFAGTVSLYARGGVNANSASELALRSAALFGDQQVDTLHNYLAGADGVPGTDDDRYFSSNDEVAALFGQLPEGASLTAGISVLRIHVEVAFGLSRFALEAVVQPGQEGGGGGAGRPSDIGQGDENAGNGGPERGNRGRDRGEQRADVSYPFVFLELTEDVGHNATIAGSVEESANASSTPSATNP